jgi:eukaryotic-like serine/threonine-protein kinase
MREESSAAPEQLEPRSGELVDTVIDGRFRVLERIGGGGMGSIFRVQHIELERQFAMKVLRTELGSDRAMVERFRREARAAASLSSEHVVGIVDSGMLPDRRPYFVMELLLGSDLRRLLVAQGTLAPARVANLGIDVCRGLTAAHRVGLIHRDLKPENLFVTRGDDGRDVCKILDFGVAKGSDVGTTRPGMLVGTVHYMAPEQVGLDASIDPRTDLHALGVILYECLCGAAPYEGDTTERLLYGIMNGTPILLRQRRPELSAELAAVVTRAFARRPEDRYASALALAEALLPFAVGRRASPSEAWWVDVGADIDEAGARHATPVLASAPDEPRPDPKPSTERPVRPFPARVAVASLLAGAAVTGGLWSIFDQRPARSADVSWAPAVSENLVMATAVEPARAEALPAPSSPSLAASARATPIDAPPSASPPTARPSARLTRPMPAARLPPGPSFDAENPYAR